MLDFLFGSSNKAPEPSRADPKQRTWALHEFSEIRLVPRESGSTPNQQPLQIDPEPLRVLLAQVRFDVPPGSQPLFGVDELTELVPSLSEALANAGPDQDLLLLSTARRGAGLLEQPLGITARLFVQGGNLNLIVHDARYEFYNKYIGSRVTPQFTFGSRGAPGAVKLTSASGTGTRNDWIVLSTTASAAAAVAPARPAAVVVAPAAAATVTAPPAPGPAAAGAPPARPRDSALGDEIEQRLTTLKRLRDKGLISEEEYQEKRREVMKLL